MFRDYAINAMIPFVTTPDGPHPNSPHGPGGLQLGVEVRHTSDTILIAEDGRPDQGGTGNTYIQGFGDIKAKKALVGMPSGNTNRGQVGNEPLDAPTRHGGGKVWNYLMCDGHVTTLKPADTASQNWLLTQSGYNAGGMWAVTP